MKKAIIYDWDGTLANSVPAYFRATQSIFKKHRVEPPSFETYVATFGPPYVTFYWDNGLPRTVSSDEIWESYLSESDGHNVDLFDDVYRTICLQRNAGYGIGLVTGQRVDILERLMQKHKCTGLFDSIICGVTPDKVSAFKETCARLEVRPEQAYSVGDFATDIRDSVKAGVTPIGIVRNGHDVSHILIEAGAERVIRKISELL